MDLIIGFVSYLFENGENIASWGAIIYGISKCFKKDKDKDNENEDK